MGDTYAILALRRKRAHLAGKIEAAECAIARDRAALAALDATIHLFEPETNPELIPAIRPTRHGLFFRHGEQTRLCLYRRYGKRQRLSRLAGGPNTP